jgi:hypothetical protein
MTRQPVESTCVAAIGYDLSSGVLEIEFKKTRSVYRYYAVPEGEYRALMNAPSKGAYLNAHIQKAEYRREKIN